MSSHDEYDLNLQAELAAARKRAEEAEHDRDSIIAEFSPGLRAHVKELPPSDANGITLDPTSIELLNDVSVEGMRRWSKAMIPAVRRQYIEIFESDTTSPSLKFSIAKHVESIAHQKFADDANDDGVEDLLTRILSKRDTTEPAADPTTATTATADDTSTEDAPH